MVFWGDAIIVLLYNIVVSYSVMTITIILVLYDCILL